MSPRAILALLFVQIAVKRRITPEQDHLRSKVDNTVRPTVTEQLVAALSERLTAKRGLSLISVAVRTNSLS